MMMLGASPREMSDGLERAGVLGIVGWLAIFLGNLMPCLLSNQSNPSQG